MVWPAATSQHHSKQHTVRKEIETSDLSTSELWVLGQHALTVCLSIMIPNRYFKVLANAIQNVHVYLMCASKPIKKNRQLIILQALTQKDKRIYLYREFHCFFFFFLARSRPSPWVPYNWGFYESILTVQTNYWNTNSQFTLLPEPSIKHASLYIQIYHNHSDKPSSLVLPGHHND